MLGKKLVLTGCMAIFMVVGNCSSVIGGGDAVAWRCADDFQSAPTLLASRVKNYGEASVTARVSRQQVRVMAPYEKGKKKRHELRAVRIGQANELAGITQRALKFKNSVKDAEILPALIGELTPPVHAAFKRVHRAMQQLLIGRRATCEVGNKKLILFQEALLAFVKNKNRWADRGSMQRLFCLAMDKHGVDPLVDRTIQHFIIVRSSIYKTSEEQLVELLGRIATRVQTAQNKLPQVRNGNNGTDDLIAQFRDFTLGVADAQGEMDAQDLYNAYLGRLPAFEADAQEEIDAQELYDTYRSSRTIPEEEELAAAWAVELEEDTELQDLYNAYLDSLPVFEDEVSVADEEERDVDESSSDEDEDDMTSKEIAKELHGRRSGW